MPSKYRIRNYKENSFYHIQNKGLGKSKIFLDDEDFQKFLYYLEVYLSPVILRPKAEESLDLFQKNSHSREIPHFARNDKVIPKRLLSKNLSKEVELISYLLLPDHFHLILKQTSVNGVSKLMKQLLNGYTFYFNKKYQSSGSLFAGKFKSVLIPLNLLIPLTHYLHAHPGVLWLANSLKSYPWSSHHDYLQSKPTFLSKDFVLSQFGSVKEYEKFINTPLNPKVKESMKYLLID